MYQDAVTLDQASTSSLQTATIALSLCGALIGALKARGVLDGELADEVFSLAERALPNSMRALGLEAILVAGLTADAMESVDRRIMASVCATGAD